ncbi:MAG: DedA family protein [Alphaproteobacteria bacterium]|jgi:membrane protein DedA with SNARE-associated domain|nr:DedA family protein [Alphaproteobacteria bacterium]
MDYLIDIIKDWGYIAVFLGSLVEGESVILVACFMAHLGYLSLTKIMIIAFCGTLFADQALYYVGRYYGQALIQRFHSLHAPANRAFKLLHSWDIWFILSFRFIWGIRTVSPIVIGTSGITPERYTPLNLIAAIVWTLISCIGGYMLAGVIEEIGLQVIKRYFGFFTIAVIIIIVAIVILKRWMKRRLETLGDEGPFHD